MKPASLVGTYQCSRKYWLHPHKSGKHKVSNKLREYLNCHVSRTVPRMGHEECISNFDEETCCKKKKVKASNPKCRWQTMILECIFREAESVDGKWKKLA